jgi:hypothetical protein
MTAEWVAPTVWGVVGTGVLMLLGFYGRRRFYPETKSATQEASVEVGTFLDSKPTPADIREGFHSLTPYQQAEHAKTFAGLAINWKCIVKGVTPIPPVLRFNEFDTRLTLATGKDRYYDSTVFCSVRIDELPRLKTTKIGEHVLVSATIYNVESLGISIFAENAKIQFLD